MGIRFLQLSLFIMMLSFFIVLNSFSSFEPSKTKNLLQSVTETFSTRPQGTTFVQPVESGEGDLNKNPLDRLDSVFQAETDTGEAEAHTNRLRTAMKVRLPVVQFEQMIADPNSDANNFVPALASVFDQGRYSYKMQMIVNVATNPAQLYNDNNQKLAEAISKASFYIQTLQDAGLPPESMTAGLGAGPEGTVDLYFQRQGGAP